VSEEDRLTEVLKDIGKKLASFRTEKEFELHLYSRILPLLGWDPFDTDECCPEYPVKSGRIDYALLHKGKVAAFIECKRPQHEIAENDKEQIVKYAFRAGARMILLTNARLWLIFYPFAPGKIDERLVVEASIGEPEKLAESLVRFFSKRNLLSGAAETEAKNLIESRQQETEMQRTLREVVREFMENPSELMMDEVAEEVEERCGLKPTQELVREAWREIFPSPSSTQPKAKTASVTSSLQHTSTTHLPPLHSKPHSMRIHKERFPLRYWYEVLVNTANWLIDRGAKLPVDEVVGDKRRVVASSTRGMTRPRPLKNGLYIEANQSCRTAVGLARWLLQRCGYDPNILHVEYIPPAK